MALSNGAGSVLDWWAAAMVRCSGCGVIRLTAVQILASSNNDGKVKVAFSCLTKNFKTRSKRSIVEEELKKVPLDTGPTVGGGNGSSASTMSVTAGAAGSSYTMASTGLTELD
ncbi:hypothetical protein HYH02_012166 [Chlamydomonas schloesseri]|uniref:Uncharacterized protein n=1 Tax=Chlamydomonas schloesseri TaxID=2026947 RepID=A0A835T0A4_9CHLO|nr:hypothetical protein HYH02_012166 [Chlamydomonas schloesseri]|eukprot:KAG2434971.1 hypothetical protein HYH02_012166 [Chlamydomonas schloesseri]